MSGRAFDQEVINAGERCAAADLLNVGNYNSSVILSFIQSVFSTRTGIGFDQSAIYPALYTAAFFGSAFKVRAQVTPALSVTMDPGIGVYNCGQLLPPFSPIVGLPSLTSFLRPLVLTSTAQEVTNIGPIAAGDPTNPRIDMVEINIAIANPLQLADLTTRDLYTPSVNQFVANNAIKTNSYALDNSFMVAAAGAPFISPRNLIVYRTGTASATPVAPAIDAGYAPIAYIRVPANATTITNSMISDMRQMLWPFGQFNVAANLTGNTASGSAPIINGLSAPPGVQVTALKFLAANGAYQGISGMALYVVAGGSNAWLAGASGVVPGIAGTMTLGSVVPLQVGSVSVFQVGQGRQNLQAMLNDPTQSAIPIAVGQDQYVCEVTVFNGGNGSGSMAPNINIAAMVPP